MSTRWVVWDSEANGLYPSKFYCLSFKDYEGATGTIIDYQEMRDFFTKYEVYVAHNCRRWDIPNLVRVVGIVSPSFVVDSLFVAWYITPERKKNGLEEFGEEYGIPKPKIIDWENQSLSDYIFRCEQDVEINHKLWEDQLSRLLDVYDDGETLKRFLKYLDFKAYCAHLAEENRWRLDVERCHTAADKLTHERDEKARILSSSIPDQPIIRTHKRPARIFKGNGEPSEAGRRWLDLLESRGLSEGYDGTVDEIIGHEPGNPSSPTQIKDWLYSLGWKPRTVKVVRNKKTGVLKEIPQVNKEQNKGGGVCSSVLELAEQEPALYALDGLSIISHRLGVLNGFLRDVSEDGYVRACIAGLTNTLRFKHAGVVNLPKPDKQYAGDIRACLIARDGKELVGSDMASLEDRLKQHFIWKYDPEYVSQLMDKDYDPHLDIAVIAKMLSQEQVDQYKAGDKSNKPVRDIAKNGNYACQYGAMPPRLVITCGITLDKAKVLYDAYWEKNWAIKQIAKDQEVKKVSGQMWLLNPINGFWYSLREKKDIFSTLVQGSASYCFDKWLGEVIHGQDSMPLLGQFHDEIVLESEQGHQEEIIHFLHECIDEVNDVLKLNRELGISVEFGKTYADIH